jgi:hypothetical protein
MVLANSAHIKCFMATKPLALLDFKPFKTIRNVNARAPI